MFSVSSIKMRSSIPNKLGPSTLLVCVSAAAGVWVSALPIPLKTFPRRSGICFQTPHLFMVLVFRLKPAVIFEEAPSFGRADAECDVVCVMSCVTDYTTVVSVFF